MTPRQQAIDGWCQTRGNALGPPVVGTWAYLQRQEDMLGKLEPLDARCRKLERAWNTTRNVAVTSHGYRWME